MEKKLYPLQKLPDMEHKTQKAGFVKTHEFLLSKRCLLAVSL